MKENDVYLFRFNEEQMKKRFEPYHCFDGKLIVKRLAEGTLYLEDTYWGNSGGNRMYTLEEAKEYGTLTFLCNLDEVETIHEGEVKYYLPEDTYNLSGQHGYHKRFAKKKGALRNAGIIIDGMLQKIEDCKREIEHKKWTIETLEKDIKKVENGDLNVWF